MRHLLLTISLVLSSLCFSSSIVLGRPARKASPVLQVSVFNEAGIPAEIVQAAESQASYIFHRAGIAIIWPNCPAGWPASPPHCAEADFPEHLHIHLLSASRDLSPSILGASFLAANGSGCSADLFYTPVAALARSSGIPQFVLLGHAMAHELGHLLLGTHSHSVQGLMRAHWDWRDLEATQRGELLFLQSEAAQINNRLRNAGSLQACVSDPQQQAAVASARC